MQYIRCIYIQLLYCTIIKSSLSCNNYYIPTKRAFILQSLEIDVNWGVALFSAQLSIFPAQFTLEMPHNFQIFSVQHQKACILSNKQKWVEEWRLWILIKQWIQVIVLFSSIPVYMYICCTITVFYCWKNFITCI